MLCHAVRRRLRAARRDGGVGGPVCSGAGVRPSGRADKPAGGPRAGRHPGAYTRGDRGMTAIEFVFLTPVLFFMIFATVQFGLYFFADHVAQAAAQAGARKARDQADQDPGWQGKATATAASYIDQLGPNLLGGRHITTLHPDNVTVGVQITANVPTIFPGLHFTVHESSQGPVERFVPDLGG